MRWHVFRRCLGHEFGVEQVAVSHVSVIADPMLLRRRIRAAAAGRRRHDSLSQRRVRDALADRFRRWFSDLELPELLRAVDPHLATVPVLVALFSRPPPIVA